MSYGMSRLYWPDGRTAKSLHAVMRDCLRLVRGCGQGSRRFRYRCRSTTGLGGCCTGTSADTEITSDSGCQGIGESAQSAGAIGPLGAATYSSIRSGQMAQYRT